MESEYAKKEGKPPHSRLGVLRFLPEFNATLTSRGDLHHLTKPLTKVLGKRRMMEEVGWWKVIAPLPKDEAIKVQEDNGSIGLDVELKVIGGKACAIPEKEPCPSQLRNKKRSW